MAQYLYLGSLNLTNKIVGPIKSTGFGWKVKQDGASSLRTGARKDQPEGSSVSFSVCYDSETAAAAALLALYPYNPDHPSFDEDLGAAIALYLRTNLWYYDVWGVVVKPSELNRSSLDYIQYHYDVICYLMSPYSKYATAQTWTATNQALPETCSLANTLGHLPSSIETLVVTCLYNAAVVTSLALNYGSTSLPLVTRANYNEVWTLKGNENRLLQVYEDAITAGTIWAIDWTGSGTYSSGKILLNNGQSAYIKLSGPNPLRYPVKMTADLSLDSGGATGRAKVYISPDAVTWTEVLDEGDFGSGATEYTLQGSEFMTNCYVKVYCNSGTSGKYLRVGSIKFECERWIEYGAPTIAAGATVTAQLTGSGNVTIAGTFRPRRMFV